MTKNKHTKQTISNLSLKILPCKVFVCTHTTLQVPYAVEQQQ